MSPMRRRGPLALLLPFAGLAAQVPGPATTAWRIPERGAVQFTCSRDLHWARADGRGVGMDSDRLLCDPLLFAGDLAADRRGLAVEPWSLQSLGPWLAFDLGWQPGQRFERTFLRVEPYGEVTVRGVARATRDGEDELVVQLSRDDVGPGPGDDDADFLRVERWYLGEQLAGRMTVRRRLDAQAGGVAAFSWEIAADVSWTSGSTRERGSVRGGEQWQRVGTVPARYAAGDDRAGFAERVEAARGLAVAAVRRGLTGADVEAEDGRGNVQGPSLLALRLAGLARAGVRRGDADAEAAFAALQERQFEVPSGIAFALLATGWLHAPADERAQRLTGAAPRPRKLPADAARYLAARTQQLLAARRTVDGGTFWSFAADSDAPDLQQTWLAVVALDEALACGVAVPPAVFAEAARFLCAAQLADGGAVAVVTAGESRAGLQQTVEPAGWPPAQERHPGHCTAHATAGALAALQVCQRRLRPSDRGQRAIAAATVRGLAWLQRHATARYDGAPLVVHRQHEPENILALAILCDELPIAVLGSRDPYFELASVLLARQRDDGVVPATVMGTAAALWLWRPVVLGPVTPRAGDDPRR